MDDYPGNKTTTGLITVFGTALAGVTDPVNDWDWIGAVLEPFTEYEFSVVGAPAGSRVDQIVRFYDPAGTQLVSAPKGSESYYFFSQRPGKHFIGISGVLGWYQVSFIQLDTEGDTRGNAKVAELNGNRYFTGSIVRPTDIDWFSVPLQANTEYTFEALAAATGHGSLSNPAFRAFDPSGKFLAGDDNSGVGTNAKLSFTSENAGDYFIQVFSPGTQTGSYHIISNQLDDWDANFRTRGQVILNGPATAGSIDYSGDKDWFKVELQPGNYYLFETGNVPLRIYDEQSRLIGSSGPHSFFEFRNYLNATNFFVEAYGTAGFDYNLKVSDTNDHPPAGSTYLGFTGLAFGQLEPGDQDWFSIELFKGGSYEFFVTGNDEYDRPADGMKLTFHDQFLNPISSSNGPNISVTAPKSGIFRVTVQGQTGTESGHYSVGARYFDVNKTVTFDRNIAVLDAALDYVRDIDQHQVFLTAGSYYSFVRTSDPLRRETKEVWQLQRPDGSEIEFNSRFSYNSSFNTNYYFASETGFHTIIENRENEFGPGAYQYIIDRNATPPASIVNPEVLENPLGPLSGKYFTSFATDQYEVYSSVDLSYDGGASLPAGTYRQLNGESFQTLVIPGDLNHENANVFVRAMQPHGQWNSWSQIWINGMVPPQQLVPDPTNLPPRRLDFDFAQVLPDYYSPGEITGFQPLGALQAGFAHRAHGRWNSDLVQLIKKQPGDPVPAQIMIFRADIPTDVMVFAPGEGRGHDIVISSTSAVMQNLQPGTEGFTKMLQAVGQSLGLSLRPELDGRSSVMGTHAPGLPFPTGPLQDDIAALLLAHEYFRYGSKTSTTTTYLNNRKPFFDLWDSGFSGNLDASEATMRVHIDLRSGQQSYVADPSGTYVYVTAPGQAYSTPSATGSPFNDMISGSNVNNVLRGGAGNDRLIGRQGNDFLFGGAGHDVYMFAPGDGQDTISEDRQGGFDTLRIDGRSNLNSLADDFTFERLGNDLLIRLEWDSQNFRDSDQVMVKDMHQPESRLESMLLVNDQGYLERISLGSVFDQLTDYRQRFAVTSQLDAFGKLVTPV